MVSQIRSITFDCADPDRVGNFWAVALNYAKREPPSGYATWADYLAAQGVPEEEASGGVAILDPKDNGPQLLFLPVPEGKVVKNRVHLDLVPEDTRDAEVQRLLECGARVVQHFDTAVGGGFTVMQDPEGNEFCVEEGPGDTAS